MHKGIRFWIIKDFSASDHCVLTQSSPTLFTPSHLCVNILLFCASVLMSKLALINVDKQLFSSRFIVIFCFVIVTKNPLPWI